MLSVKARAAPAVTGRDPQAIDRHGRAINLPNNTASTEPATVAAHHDRAWWRVEARRVGSDWPAVLALHAAVVAAWRARHDYGGAA
jgi:hypothetical protein